MRVISEGAADQIDEFLGIEFALMEWIVVSRLVGIFQLAGAGDHEQPARPQNPAQFGDHGVMVGEMLNGLEGYHHVHRVVRQRDRGRAADPERNIRITIPVCGICNRLPVDIDPDDRLCGHCQNGGPVTLARGDIENVPPFR